MLKNPKGIKNKILAGKILGHFSPFLPALLLGVPAANRGENS
jgi:hypothetical protein